MNDDLNIQQPMADDSANVNASDEQVIAQPAPVDVPQEAFQPVADEQAAEESAQEATEAPQRPVEHTWAQQQAPLCSPTAGQWYPPAVQDEVQKPKKTKKGWTAGKVIALSLCCSLVGGIAGGVIMSATLRGTAAQPGHSNVFEGDRDSTVIDVNQIETGSLMTPAQVYAKNVNSTVGITTSVTTNFWGYQTTSAASGSGFVYSDDGYILTNYHVVEDSNAISVSMYDGRTLDAKLVGYDESNDIAVLKVEAENLAPVIIGDSSNLNVGDSVIAIGNPLGELTFSLTSGVVSALAREVTFSDGITMSLIQTDCAINSGNSGGALFNLYGEVIGITNAKYSGSSNSSASIDNIGFAIPVNRIRSIVDSIIENGFVVKPYIGVSIVDVSEETQSYGLPKGAAIRSIEAESPAQECGLQVNDIITHVNGEEITGASDLKMCVTESKPGDELELKVWRKGTTIDLTLTVGQQIQAGNATPQQNQQPNVDPYFNWGY